MPLLIHGEVTDPAVDIFDREARFIEQVMEPIRRHFPELKIVFEHITTKEAAQYVQAGNRFLGATITPQHLMFNRNHMLVGGIRPHLFCLPILKRNVHQEALRQAVASGSDRFFLGTDSAPHLKHRKESSCRLRRLLQCAECDPGLRCRLRTARRAGALRGLLLAQRPTFLWPADQRRFHRTAARADHPAGRDRPGQ